jgi:nucleotide-binding universal stress UspA family protein
MRFDPWVNARVSLAGDRSSREWLAQDRLLVAVGPDEQAEQLVRAGKRLADALRAKWTVVYVETPELLRLKEQERDRRIDLLRLAESLGAETVTLDGPTAAEALIEYAQTRRATRIIVGAPKRRGWRALWRRSTATALTVGAKGFDVVTVAPTGVPSRNGATLRAPAEYAKPVRWKRYVAAVAISAACTAVAFGMYPYLELSNLVMVYLLGVVIAGLRVGRLPSVLTAVLNVLCFDFFFVAPRFQLAVTDVQYFLTFAVMLTVALVIATLMARVRQQTRVAGARERRTALLYAMSRELAARGATAWRGSRSARRRGFQCECVVLPPTGACDISGGTDGGSYRGADCGRAMGRGPRPPRRLGIGHAAGRAGAVSVARNRAPRPRCARRAAAQSAPSPVARTAASARDVRRADRPRRRASGPRRDGGRCARRCRARNAAQHAARVDLPRPTHAARRHGRRRVDARRARHVSRRCEAHRARALDRVESPRHVGARVEGAGSHALRFG